MPKMGESIMEATILNWSKKVGDSVSEDETVLEIATDKVDSEVPSPVDGVISEILFNVDDVVEVGKVIAIINTPKVKSLPQMDTSLSKRQSLLLKKQQHQQCKQKQNPLHLHQQSVIPGHGFTHLL